LAILSIQHLSKTYGNTKALSDISLEIPKGGIFGLLGPNGAGKTTLIRIINQIIEADSGVILFNGSPLSPRHIANIGYLPEERGLYKKMKVGDQLRYFARLKGMSGPTAKEKVHFWLKKLDILSWQDKRIDDLSKGMAQKVQFITTVIHEPELVILDEPFSGFDPVNAEIIRNEILELREKGTTLVISTHRMESVEQLCDQIAMIYRSEKILDGKLRDIKQAFRPNQFQVQLKTDALDALQYHPLRFEDGVAEFNVSLEGENTNQLLSRLMALGEVMGFTEILMSMEEIFIQQVKKHTHE
jgi:ABC-2 type transport system ATP-binding protein